MFVDRKYRVAPWCGACSLLTWMPLNAQADVTTMFMSNTPSGTAQYEMAEGMAGGLAASDFDKDGFVDLFIPTEAGVPNLLLRSLGSGNFEEVAVQFGLAATDAYRSALWFDANGDTLQDLVIVSDCWGWLGAIDGCSSLTAGIKLYTQNEDGTFADVTAGSGLTIDVDAPSLFGAPHVSGMAAGDLNLDGWLDLIVGAWNGQVYVFENNADDTFTDISDVAGFDTVNRSYWQPVIHDFNGDGWPDIYYAIDFTPNQLWINQQDGTFVDIAVEAGADNAMNDMGIALGD